MEKLADFAGMSDEQRKEYRQNIQEGLLTNLLADGSEIVAPETMERLKAVTENGKQDEDELKAALGVFFQEMTITEAGKRKFSGRIKELVMKMVGPALNRLSQEQKAEIARILEQE